MRQISVLNARGLYVLCLRFTTKAPARGNFLAALTSHYLFTYVIEIARSHFAQPVYYGTFMRDNKIPLFQVFSMLYVFRSEPILKQ